MTDAILVTGSTGLVGSAILGRLAGGGAIGLTHQARQAAADSPVLDGDVTQPRLGLASDAYRSLSDRIGTIVHCAATTWFDAPRDEVFAVNVEGTKRVLDLASDAGARLIHLSTAFIAVEPKDAGRGLSPKHYLDSKRASEALVRESGLDFHIVRPSIVIGDSDTGYTPRLQGYHLFVKALLRGSVPIVPFDENDRVDFVSNDTVGDVVEAIVASPPREREVWLTAGDRAWTLARLVAEVLRFAEEHRHAVQAPRLVPPDMVERLIRPVFFPALPKKYARRYDQFIALRSILSTPVPFASTLSRLPRPDGGEWALELERTFERSVAFLLQSLTVPASAS
jgi:nucleoside-diphosphate-sugar epimerase